MRRREFITLLADVADRRPIVCRPWADWLYGRR